MNINFKIDSCLANIINYTNNISNAYDKNKWKPLGLTTQINQINECIFTVKDKYWCRCENKNASSLGIS